MLLELEIENLALLKHVRVPFASGLNAITGATGAGKTLLLEGLDLVRGRRAEKTRIRDGAAECRVAARLRIDARLRPALAALLPDVPLDDDELVVARTVHADGRSRSSANGRLVALAQLRSVGDLCFDVVGQGEAHRFAESERRAALLDEFGGHVPLFDAYRAARDAACDATATRNRLASGERERRRALDYLRFQRDEIDQVGVAPGESAALESELSVLASAESLAELSDHAVADLYEDDEAILARIDRLLKRAREHSGGAAELIEPAARALARAHDDVEEAAREFRAARDRIPTDPERKSRAIERLELVRRILDRYGPTDEDVARRRCELDVEIARLESDERDAGSADADVLRAERALAEAASALDRARVTAGKRLSSAVESALHALGMPGARFRVDVAERAGPILERATTTGASELRFLLQANPGLAERPLQDVASGGESARIALAIESAVAAVQRTPILVFDEIESGIGARLAAVLGRVLRSLARDRQLLVVTHLAQVAEAAEHHLRISKRSERGATVSTVETLSGPARKLEIAEMAGAERERGA